MENTAEALVGKPLTTEERDTDEERAFRLRARQWMGGRLPPRIPGEPAMSYEREDLVKKDREIQRLLWDGGLAGITIPSEYGGLGLSQRFEDVFHEEAQPYRLAWHYGTGFNTVIPVLLAHGTEAQKKKYIAGMYRGDQMWCQMLSEPSGGSDLAGLLTRAERRGDGWVLNGSKVWTSGGAQCDMGICLARTDPTVRKHAGLTMFLVNMRAPGMTINPIRLVHGGSDFCQEFLDDVAVPDEDRVGEVNDGWTVATTQLAGERAGMAKGWNAGLSRAAASEHIRLPQSVIDKARSLGVSEDPLARQLVGETFVLDAVYNIAGKYIGAGVANGRMPATTGIVHSLMAARTSVRRTALMSALAGPAGVTAEPGHSPGIGISRVTTHRIGGGTQETQLNLVAERHLGLPREPSFDKDLPFNQIKTNAVTKR